MLGQIGVQAKGGPLTDDQRTALETALRYFREAAPRHTADEEQSLFPRLRSLDRPELNAILPKLDSLEADHTRADHHYAEIDRLGRQWLESGTLSSTDAARFSALAAELANLYRGHLALEENELFPVAAAALNKAECDAMGDEMEARRGLRRT